ERKHHIRNLDAFAVRKRAADSNGCFCKIRATTFDLELDAPVIKQEVRMFLERSEYLWVRQRDASAVTRRLRVKVQPKSSSWLELDGSIQKRTDPQFRSLKIKKHANGSIRFLLNGSDYLQTTLMLFVSTIAEVQ